MVVLFRESAQDPLKIGIYEHEGLGWILQEELPATMQLHEPHTYQISATLDKNELAVILQTDNNKETQLRKTVTVSEISNQRTYGVISSGVAIQWDQQAPVVKIQDNTQARPRLKQMNEQDREKRTKQIVQQLNQITFGPIELQSLSKQAILFGQYLYMTKNTNISKINPRLTQDYMVFATFENGQIKNIGSANEPIDPNSPTPNVIVSVITGHVYNKQGNIVHQVNNVWSIYEKSHGPFSPTLSNYITKAAEAVIDQLSKITFGEFELDIASTKALQKGQYIYTCNQTLFDPTTNKPITDYLVAAEITDKSLGRSIGMPPTSANAQGLISLVTGNLYAKDTPLKAGQPAKPIAEGYSELYAYENQFGTVAPIELKAIKLAQSKYRTAQAKPKTTPKIITFSSSSASSDSTSSKQQALSSHNPSIILLGPPSKGSISQLQQKAAGPIGLQLFSPQPKTKTLGIQLGRSTKEKSKPPADIQLGKL